MLHIHLLAIERLYIFERTVGNRTHEQILVRVIDGNGARFITDCHVILITAVQHGLAQEIGGAVRNHNVALHLANTQSTIICATTHRLTRQLGARSLGAVIDLVFHHVFQTHIIIGTNVHLCLQLFARHAVIKQFVARRMKIAHIQHLAKLANLFICRRECRAVAVVSHIQACLAHQTLH